jgi:hypothetical protein
MDIWPAWFDPAPNWQLDQTAYESLGNGAGASAHTLHRAVRHHHWHNALNTVQHWTRRAWGNSEENKYQDDLFWHALSLTVVRKRMRLVNHLLVKRIDGRLQELIRSPSVDQALILREIRKWQNQVLRRNPKRPIWVTDKAQVDARSPFSGGGLHALIAALGLWHFGEMNAGVAYAVLRLEYEVDEQVVLFKPDWRHGHPNFYWAQAPHNTDHGLARDLQTGQQICKEWVAPLEQLSNRLVTAEFVVPVLAHNHHELPVAYWHQVETDIRNQADTQSAGERP